MTNCKPKDISIAKEQSRSLDMCSKTPQEKERMVGIPYTNAIESFMYAMMCTKLDISYAMGLVNRYQSNPGQKHGSAVKRILAYLKGTSNYSLYYQGGDLRLVEYSDAD